MTDGQGLLLILGTVAFVAIGMGWECERCGQHTGFLWPRPCPDCAREINDPTNQPGTSRPALDPTTNERRPT